MCNNKDPKISVNNFTPVKFVVCFLVGLLSGLLAIPLIATNILKMSAVIIVALIWIGASYETRPPYTDWGGLGGWLAGTIIGFWLTFYI